jgi:glycosyltransferase involved in cell wall biosynthesis
MKTVVLLPAYNEAAHLGAVLDGLIALGYRDVVVCDDGSTDGTAEVARARGVHVVRHPLNRGPGAASATAVEVGLRLGAEALVLMDADGQHLPADVPRLVAALAASGALVALGNRRYGASGMPFFRRVLNALGTLVTRLLGGASVADSQCGFRALRADAAHKLRIRSNGFEYCSDMLREIRRQRIPYVEVPVAVVYHRRSLSKGQSLANGLTTAWRLVFRTFR